LREVAQGLKFVAGAENLRQPDALIVSASGNGYASRVLDAVSTLEETRDIMYAKVLKRDMKKERP
jgi:hypothetical protein